MCIYGGLIYLGSTSGITNLDIKRSELLIHISRTVLGEYGTLAIALSIALACLTTAIAVTAAVGTFFSELTGGRISYKILVTICCLISAVLSITGVDNIIQFAYPPLAFVYPIVITLVLYIVIFGRFITSKLPYVGALIATTLIASLGLLNMFNLLSPQVLVQLNRIPYFEYELGWVVPSIVFFVLFFVIEKIRSLRN